MKRKCYLEFWWAIHNLIAHPLGHIVWILGFFGAIKPIAKLSGWIHDSTIPVHKPGEGNG